MGRTPVSPVLRGLLVGLIAGLLIGGLALFIIGARAVVIGPDCAALTPEECGLDRNIAASLGRRQVWAGGALALMGVAVFMLARSRLSRPHPEGTEP